MLWVKDLGISVVAIAAGDGVHGVRIFHGGVGRISSSRGVSTKHQGEGRFISQALSRTGVNGE